MKRLVFLSISLLSIVGLSVATEQRASGFTGYVDPGSGLLAIQCIASAFATTCYFMRRKIAALFTSKNDKKQDLVRPEATADSPLNDL
jgi:hypothetical protein